MSLSTVLASGEKALTILLHSTAVCLPLPFSPPNTQLTAAPRQPSALTRGLLLRALHPAKQALQLAGGGLEGRQRAHIVVLRNR